MVYTETSDYSFFLGKDHFVYDVSETAGQIDIYVKARPHSCKCPSCGNDCRRLHATYVRTLQDTPIRCKPTYLHANVYKYECENVGCEEHIFMETLPFASASQVRTDTLNTLILAMAMFMSNEGASKILKLIGVNVSNDTIQRIYDRIEFKDEPDVEAVGIDDVATRKGQAYATAIYDLKDHHMIALLDGRNGKALKDWLKNHKKIRLIARDRASAYASAISEILPECMQVADRFHLLQNLLERLRCVFKEEVPNEIFIRDGKLLEAAPQKVPAEKAFDSSVLAGIHYDNSPPVDKNGEEVIYDDRKRNLNSTLYKNMIENRKKNRT
mgnify:CR=1 FL=1